MSHVQQDVVAAERELPSGKKTKRGAGLSDFLLNPEPTDTEQRALREFHDAVLARFNQRSISLCWVQCPVRCRTQRGTPTRPKLPQPNGKVSSRNITPPCLPLRSGWGFTARRHAGHVAGGVRRGHRQGGEGRDHAAGRGRPDAARHATSSAEEGLLVSLDHKGRWTSPTSPALRQAGGERHRGAGRPDLPRPGAKERRRRHLLCNVRAKL